MQAHPRPAGRAGGGAGSGPGGGRLCGSVLDAGPDRGAGSGGGPGWSTRWPGWICCCTALGGARRSRPAGRPSGTRQDRQVSGGDLRSRPGSRTTTPPAGTRRWACSAHSPMNRPSRLQRRRHNHGPRFSAFKGAPCSAQSRSFLRGPGGPCGGSIWTGPALRRSNSARENRDQTKISSDQSVHGLRGTRVT
jgi:hypothetical protein